MHSADDNDGVSMNRSSDDHPDEIMLAGYLDNDLDTAERTTIETHLDTCPACRRAVAEASRVLSDASAAASIESRTTAPRGRWIVGGLAVAASVAAVLLIRPAAQPRSSKDLVREASAPVTEGMPVLREYEPSNGVRLTAPPTTFRWASAGDIDRYQFVLLSADASTIWSTETPDTALSLPADVSRRLTAGSTYLWRVDALRGVIEATTRTKSFTLAR
jgi:anti-sigma factor RsiW